MLLIAEVLECSEVFDRIHEILELQEDLALKLQRKESESEVFSWIGRSTTPSRPFLTYGIRSQALCPLESFFLLIHAAKLNCLLPTLKHLQLLLLTRGGATRMSFARKHTLDTVDAVKYLLI